MADKPVDSFAAIQQGYGGLCAPSRLCNCAFTHAMCRQWFSDWYAASVFDIMYSVWLRLAMPLSRAIKFNAQMYRTMQSAMRQAHHARRDTHTHTRGLMCFVYGFAFTRKEENDRHVLVSLVVAATRCRQQAKKNNMRNRRTAYAIRCERMVAHTTPHPTLPLPT